MQRDERTNPTMGDPIMSPMATVRRQLRGRLSRALGQPDVRWLSQQGLRIGRNVYIGGGCHFDLGFLPLISIGNDATIAPGVRVIAHDASMRHSTGHALIARVHIGNHVYIGAGAILLPGVNLGDGAIIGAGAVVRGDIPPGSLVVGNPAQVVGSVEEFAGRHRQRQAGRPTYPLQLFGGGPATMGEMTDSEIKRILNELADGPAYVD
jgi:maltose O-acetyltransferase